MTYVLGRIQVKWAYNVDDTGSDEHGEIVRHWDAQLTEHDKNVYRKMAGNDRARYDKEMVFWSHVKWMSEKPYEQREATSEASETL